MKKVIFVSVIIIVMMFSFCFAEMESYNITTTDKIYMKIGSTIKLVNDVNDVLRNGNDMDHDHRVRIERGELSILGCSFEISDREEYVYYIKGIAIGSSKFKFNYTTRNGESGNKTIDIIVNYDGKEHNKLPWISNEDVDNYLNPARERARKYRSRRATSL
jgi:hypothetical protein